MFFGRHKMFENLFVGGAFTALKIVPLLRGIAGSFLAVYIFKNSKARNFDNSFLWALFALVSPAFAVIGYFIKVKLYEDKTEAQLYDKDKIKKSKKFFVISFIIYALALIVLFGSVVVSISAGAIGIAKDEIELFPSYYDSEGNVHEDYETIPIYDKEGNEYHLDEITDGWNTNSYYDQNGKEYLLDYCYISQDGYFYYDENDELEDTHESTWYYSKHWKDKNGVLYAHIDDGVFWDEDGNLCIVYKGNQKRKAFD